MARNGGVRPEELATVAEIAVEYGLAESTVWLLIRQFSLQRYRVPAHGKKTLIRRADFERARNEPVEGRRKRMVGNGGGNTMPVRLTRNEIATWLAHAADAGLTPDMNRDDLVRIAGRLGIDVHWMIPRGTDIHGGEHALYIAFVRNPDGSPEESIEADTLERAICLVAGESIANRNTTAP